MRFLPLFFGCLAIGCSGTPAPSEPPCTSKPPPLGAPVVRLALWRVDFGEKGAAATRPDQAWSTLGFDLDGVCSTSAAKLGCARHAGAPASGLLDGVDGIDNSFGKNAIPFLAPIYGHSTDRWSGHSWLDVGAAGRGALVLAMDDGLVLRVPLVDVRLDWNGTTGTLGAIVPTAAFLENVRKDLGAVSPELCAGSTLDSVLTTIDQMSDISASGIVDPTAACDGISIGMELDGAPVDALPDPPASPCGAAADAGP